MSGAATAAVRSRRPLNRCPRRPVRSRHVLLSSVLELQQCPMAVQHATTVYRG
jgi:hypothetical protein